MREELDSFDCEKCRKYRHYKEKACDGKLIPSRAGTLSDEEAFIFGEYRFSFCPKLLLFDNDIIELVELFQHYEAGFLYTDGGIIDQPYWYVVAMNRLKSEFSKWQSKLN